MLLPATLAAGQMCIVQLASGDYQCFDETAYSGTDFTGWCSAQGGTTSTASKPPQCDLVCCCNAADESPLDPNPVSATYCGEHYPAYVSRDVSETESTAVCDAKCADASGPSGGGAGSESFVVTGRVYNKTSPPKTQGLGAVKVEYPVGSALVTVYTASDGSFSLPNVPKGNVNIKASRADCGGQTQLVTVAGAMAVDFELDCNRGPCSDAVDDAAATPVRAEKRVTVSWTPTTCGQGYLVTRCEFNSGNNCSLDGAQTIGYAGVTASTFFDTTVQAGTGYCYFVNVLTGVSTAPLIPPSVTGASHCVMPMSEYCLTHDVERQMCFNDEEGLGIRDTEGIVITQFTGFATCNNANQLDPTTRCDAGLVCSYSATGTPTCAPAGECAKCNGLFGWFIDLAAKVTMSGTTCEALVGCVLNNEGYAADTFQSCSEIRSCADYRTRAACETPGQDRCKVTEAGCHWVDAPGLAELGKGACIPNDAQPGEAVCDECDNLFGACDTELCGLLGECYYNADVRWGSDGETARCIAKEQAACAYYDDAKSCAYASLPEGANPNFGTPLIPTYDVTYDKPNDVLGLRKAGSNAQKTAMDDVFGFGKCAWVVNADGSGACIKDANGKIASFSEETEKLDDCLEKEGLSLPNGKTWHDCFHDTTPPNTTLPFDDGMYLDADLLRIANVIVTDETFGLLDAPTWSWFCLATAGATCYPDRRLNNLVPEEVGVGAYTVYYYSEDPAGNLEVVRSIDLLIEQDSRAHLVEARLELS